MTLQAEMGAEVMENEENIQVDPDTETEKDDVVKHDFDLGMTDEEPFQGPKE